MAAKHATLVISDPAGATLTVQFVIDLPEGCDIQGAVDGTWTSQARMPRYLRPAAGLDGLDRFGIAWAIVMAFGTSVQRAASNWHDGSVLGAIFALNGAVWFGVLLRAAWRATR